MVATLGWAVIARQPAIIIWTAPIVSTPSFDDYYGWLAASCGLVDIWSTTYLHVLEGEDPVVDWMMGTALRPYLDALTDAAERSAFLAEFTARIARAFPPREDGVTLFPFPRLFMVARRP